MSVSDTQAKFSYLREIDMTWVIRTSLLLSLILVIGGCAAFGIETGYRTLTIRNHQFDQTEVVVPKDQPFILTLDGIDDIDLAISAPELGITLLRVPATPKSLDPTIVTQSLPGRSARLPLGPLKAGRYSITCACHGHPNEAILVAR